MTYLHKSDPENPRAAELGEALSRREALSMAGAIAAGVGAAAAHAESPRDDSDARGRPIGEAAPPANAVEFRARFVQTGASGEDFAAYGYLTRASGASTGDLFWGTTFNESAALLTAARSVSPFSAR